ncbi:MAG: phosphate ABC transporter permease subunit PstC [Verrucomicrobia bacterium]|nr:phosphate ABC transporter permease subunit PstC [Verrucomicrobiota bacterium]MDE3099153.1 phosphate ABC transporter permease subunit PstC [Verrucomicrobiota bacterium]
MPGMGRSGRFGDRAFRWLTCVMALVVLGLVLLIVVELVRGSHLSLRKFGWHFLVSSDWDPLNGKLGALTFIYGTLVTSAVALVIAIPVSVGAAVFLTEVAPLWIRQPIVMFIELLAAVPSVVIGLWGLFILVPVLRDYVEPFLQKFFGFLPIFQGPILGFGFLAAGVVLAIMITPIITSISREILRSVPSLQREAAYALGATPWEVTRIAVLSYAKKGIFGAVILGLGRALGETMAATMIIGNVPNISRSLFAMGYTLPSVLASEFTEAVDPMYLSALFELALVLMGITLIVNALAQLLLKTFAGPTVKPQH